MKLIALILVIATTPALAQKAPISLSLPSNAKLQGQFVQLQAASVPADVINAIKAAPTESARGIAGFYRFGGQILKADTLTFNARALMQLDRTDVPWIAIVAKDIYIEVPASRDESARITRAPDSLFGNQDGGTAGQGSLGRSDWPTENGSHGGPGGAGGTGGPGRTATVPTVYLFFQRINLSAGSPAAVGLLRFALNGLAGGNGGQGGAGGNGGAGAPGSPSECNTFECRTGPGKGGNGGQGGSGGRGGNGGIGGNGGNLVLAGPASEWKSAAFFEVIQEAGPPGTGGSPGAAGAPGIAGGGGHRCHACNGRDGGNGGPAAAPENLGPGSSGTPGARGTKVIVDRMNADLF